MRSVNRIAIVVRPKPAFFEWLRSLEGPPINVEPWCSVNLVAAPEDEPPEKTLRRHFSDVFEEQLFGWTTEEAEWPPRRTLALFQKWFDVSIGDIVFDLSVNKPLEYDD
jgi:hypothetical protein